VDAWRRAGKWVIVTARKACWSYWSRHSSVTRLVQVRNISGEAGGKVGTVLQLTTWGLLLENFWTAVGCCARAPEVGCRERAKLDGRRPSLDPTINIKETCVLWLTWLVQFLDINVRRENVLSPRILWWEETALRWGKTMEVWRQCELIPAYLYIIFCM
jgi:hypothetical protein